MDITETQPGRVEWDNGLIPSGSPLQQCWAYGRAMETLGTDVRRFEVRTGGRRGQAQVVSRSIGPMTLALLNRGPVWDAAMPPACAAAALRQLARSSCGILLATPPGPVPGRGAIPLITARTEALLDLSPGLPTLRANLSGKWRNRLLRAESAGFSVTVSTPAFADLAPLLTHETAQRRTRRYGGLPPVFLAAWLRVAPDAALLVTAGDRDGLLAGMLFLTHGRSATYQLGWTSDRGRRMHAHNATLWSAVNGLRARGIAHLNLGDIATDRNPGLARFKLGTGAIPHPLGPTCLILPSIRRPW